MIKENKHLVLFISLLLILALGVLLDLGKLFHLTFQHTAYYCQAFFHNFSFKIPHGLSIFLILTVLTGGILTLVKIFLAFSQIRSLRKFLNQNIQKDQKFEEVLESLKLTNCAFLVHSNKPFAFCFGIRQPNIYISTSTYLLMNKEELKCILLHEQYHQRKRDTLTMFIASLIQFSFPFFPVISDIVRNYKISREINADREVVELTDSPKTLLNIFKKLLSTSNTYPAFVSAIGDHDTIEYRIQALLSKRVLRQQFSMKNILVTLVSLLCFSYLAFAPVYAVNTNNSKNTVMICAVSNDCARWCRLHQTVNPSLYSISPNASYPYTPVSHSL